MFLNLGHLYHFELKIQIQNNFIFLFRMEVHGKPGRIQISANTKTILELTEAEGYAIKSRGRISVKVLICRFLVVYL